MTARLTPYQTQLRYTGYHTDTAQVNNMVRKRVIAFAHVFLGNIITETRILIDKIAEGRERD